MATIRKVMIKNKLCEEEAQSIREIGGKGFYNGHSCKTNNKKTKGKDEAEPSKVLAQEKTLSLVAKSKGRCKANVGLSTKRTIVVPEKNKGKEKVPKSNEKPVHVDLHSSKESSEDGEFL